MHIFWAERFGSGDGERKTLMTRQIASEPLPASVLFALGCGVVTANHAVLCAGTILAEPLIKESN